VEVLIDGAYVGHAQGLMGEYTHESSFELNPNIATTQAVLG